MSSPPSPEIIYELPLDDLPGLVLDISPVATPGRFRFIDCQAYVEDQLFRLVEVPDIRAVAYSVISYVWRGNPPPPGETLQSRCFAVRGAEDGDPISLDILRYASLTSLLSEEWDDVDDHGWQLPPLRFPNPRLRRARYLWLDRACIVQTSRNDKAWQITQMFDVYRCCTQCLILPGGIQRLVSLDEETSWVHRAWTLQEMLAPCASFVLFDWPWGTGKLSSEIGDFDVSVHIIVPHLCAAVKASLVLNGCISAKVQFTPARSARHPTGKRHAHISYLSGTRGYLIPVCIFGAKTVNLYALLTALDSVDEHRARAIWQSALARTSSRPVDMVFSIMGLFGVSLNPKAFKADDRIGATIALAQAILRDGGTASWIGVSTRARPCPQLSTFPEFPQTSVSGKAMLVASSAEPIEAAALLDGDSLGSMAEDTDWVDPMTGEADSLSSTTEEAEGITGDMDDAGYITFERKACVLERALETDRASSLQDEDSNCLSGKSSAYTSLDGRRWVFHEDAKLTDRAYPRTAAVVLGFFEDMYRILAESDSESDSEDGSESSDSVTSESDWFKMVLVEEHAPEKFHVASYFVIGDSRRTWPQKNRHWATYMLCVGGPESLDHFS